MSLCTFADYPFLIPTKDSDNYLDSHLPLSGSRIITSEPINSPSNMPGLTYPRQYPDPLQLKLNEWFYPTGAIRWSQFNALIDSPGYLNISESCFDSGVLPAPFVMEQEELVSGTIQSITTEMYCLPLRPIAPGLWLVTLVDERYFFQYKTAFNLDFTSWETLIAGIASQVGITITHEAIDAVYGLPNVRTSLSAENPNIGALLDAIGWNIGCIFIRNMDGTYTFQSIEDIEEEEDVALYAGGDFALTPSNNAIVPQTVSVSFPYLVFCGPGAGYRNAQVNNLPSPLNSGDYYSKVINFSDVFPESELIGFDGVVTFTDTAPAYIKFEIDDVPINKTELDDLAYQIAKDYYNWYCLNGKDLTIPGVFEWLLEGYNDLTFIWTGNTSYTRVQRKPYNTLYDSLLHTFESPVDSLARCKRCHNGSSDTWTLTFDGTEYVLEWLADCVWTFVIDVFSASYNLANNTLTVITTEDEIIYQVVDWHCCASSTHFVIMDTTGSTTLPTSLAASGACDNYCPDCETDEETNVIKITSATKDGDGYQAGIEQRWDTDTKAWIDGDVVKFKETNSVLIPNTYRILGVLVNNCLDDKVYVGNFDGASSDVMIQITSSTIDGAGYQSGIEQFWDRLSSAWVSGDTCLFKDGNGRLIPNTYRLVGILDDDTEADTPHKVYVGNYDGSTKWVSNVCIQKTYLSGYLTDVNINVESTDWQDNITCESNPTECCPVGISCCPNGTASVKYVSLVYGDAFWNPETYGLSNLITLNYVGLSDQCGGVENDSYTWFGQIETGPNLTDHRLTCWLSCCAGSSDWIFTYCVNCPTPCCGSLFTTAICTGIFTHSLTIVGDGCNPFCAYYDVTGAPFEDCTFIDSRFGIADDASFSSCPFPAVTYNCLDGACTDPHDGSGTYSTLSACQVACDITPTYNCVSGACVDPGDGTGTYSTLTACESACGVTPSWYCNGNGICHDPGDGSGGFATEGDCLSACHDYGCTTYTVASLAITLTRTSFCTWATTNYNLYNGGCSGHPTQWELTRTSDDHAWASVSYSGSGCGTFVNIEGGDPSISVCCGG